MFRLDRFLTIYLFGPLSQLRNKGNRLRIPILMYHSISDEPETGHPYYWINTYPKRFNEHMKFLHDNNYKVISLSDAVSLIINSSNPINSINPTNLINPSNSSNQIDSSNPSNQIDLINPSLCSSPQRGGGQGEGTNPNNQINQIDQIDQSNSINTNIPSFHNSNIPKEKYVVLTFDDGYADFYTNAFPILSKLGFTATVFLPTGIISKNGKGLRGKEHLSWQMVQELSRQGISFGSHTVNHVRLEFLDEKALKLELIKSKEEIEERIGQSVELFSYPYRFLEKSKFLNKLKNCLMETGYEAGVTTRVGTANTKVDLFFLPRLPVNSSDDLKFFEAKLDGAYNWIYIPQKATKFFRKQTKQDYKLKNLWD